MKSKVKQMLTKLKEVYDTVMTFYDRVIEKIEHYPDFALAIAVAAVIGAVFI